MRDLHVTTKSDSNQTGHTCICSSCCSQTHKQKGNRRTHHNNGRRAVCQDKQGQNSQQSLLVLHVRCYACLLSQIFSLSCLSCCAVGYQKAQSLSSSNLLVFAFLFWHVLASNLQCQNWLLLCHQCVSAQNNQNFADTRKKKIAHEATQEGAKVQLCQTGKWNQRQHSVTER